MKKQRTLVIVVLVIIALILFGMSDLTYALPSTAAGTLQTRSHAVATTQPLSAWLLWALYHIWTF